MSRFAKKALQFAALLVLGVLLLYLWKVAALFLNQSNHVYFPKKEWVATPASVGLTYEDTTIKTSDGVALSAWYLASPENKGTILLCHGNAGNISYRLPELSIYYGLGYNVLIFDYRRYGKSGDSPLSEEATYRDAEAAHRYLTDVKKVPTGEIILAGRSLGAGVASHLAVWSKPKALILESGFTSLDDLASEMYPHFPVRLLIKHHYPTLQNLSQVDAPVLLVHSRGDSVVPFSHGEALYRAAREPKYFLEIQGPHNEGYELSKEAYRAKLKEFLSSL
jgi:hypothetical protein